MHLENLVRSIVVVDRGLVIRMPVEQGVAIRWLRSYMPDECFILDDIRCPSCQNPFFEAMMFQWGAVPVRPDNRIDYHIGDRLRWMRSCDGAVVEPFVVCADEDGREWWNCGNPDFPNVILLDMYLALNYVEPVQCDTCGFRGHQVIAVVRNGIFADVCVLDEQGSNRLLGEKAGKTCAIVVREDGSYWFQEDGAHPLRFTDEVVPAVV